MAPPRIFVHKSGDKRDLFGWNEQPVKLTGMSQNSLSLELKALELRPTSQHHPYHSVIDPLGSAILDFGNEELRNQALEQLWPAVDLQVTRPLGGN